jgi:acyl carrier protein
MQENRATLRRIVIDAFELEPAEYSDELHQDEVEKWDSMGMVSLIVELEAAFDLAIPLHDFSRFISVAAIIDVLREHGVALEDHN